ncbi:uncharacterized protein LOC144156063 [Haemaphysalis longicornis]
MRPGTCGALLLLLLALVALASAVEVSTKRAHLKNGRCVYAGREIFHGRVRRRTPCQQISCDIRKREVTIESCGPLPELRPGCELKQGRSFYPDCCPKVICR